VSLSFKSGGYQDPQQAEQYSRRRWTETNHARRTNAWEVQAISELYAATDAKTVLDFPCGNGRLTSLWEGLAEQLWSGDASLLMLQNREEERVAFQGDLLKMPVASQAVDLISAIRVLHHFSDHHDRVTAYQEMARVSRRYVLVSYYDSGCLPAWRDQLLHKSRSLSYQSAVIFKKETAAAGLREVSRLWRRRFWSPQALVLLTTQ
jgi:SAM-dependent methyltransferase